MGTGQSRKQLAKTLSAAYAAGLLSEDTYVHRIDELLGSAVVHPGRLAGDLNFRESAGGLVPSLLARVARLRAGVPRLAARSPGRTVDIDPAALLALDWDGSTPELTVGRNDGCDVILTDPEVSRRHAQLRYRDGRWILQDLASTNGTYVNGVRIGRCELRAGDHIALGKTEFVID